MEQGSVQRSALVTVIAWILVIGAGMGVLISAFQFLIFSVMGEQAEFARAMQQMPEMHQQLFAKLPLIIASVLGLSLVSFITGIGLLKRQRWARMAVIALLVLGIIAQLAGAVFQYYFATEFMAEMMADMQRDFGQMHGFNEQFETMQNVALIFNVLFCLAFAGFFGWLIVKFSSRDIRAEFAH